VRDLAATLKVQQADVVGRVETIAEERRRLERELSDAKKKLAMGGGSAAASEAVRTIGTTEFVPRIVSGVAPKDLKGLVDEARNGHANRVVVLIGRSDDGKPASIVVGVTPDAAAANNAVDLVRVAAEVMGGKGGGGRPDMAQGGGPDASKAEAAIEAIAERIRASVGG
jgi:alanyl-tRNA synthetase